MNLWRRQLRIGMRQLSGGVSLYRHKLYINKPPASTHPSGMHWSTGVWNTLRIANLAGGAFGFFYCLCSFDICTLPSLCPPVTYARYIANCVGVNAAIYIRAVC